ncbi:proline-rich protein 22-like, partial [Haliaeetus albicilla]|uniref:proline-rich protein 22-like n=1 Tax=Haliaeetus albicilla TaxID=8969 RepID=UPI0037E784C5
CGCLFDPRVFRIQWTTTHLPPRSGVAPAPLELPLSIPGYQHSEGQLAQINIPSMATPVGAPLGSDVPPSPCAASHNQAVGDTAGDLAVSEEMLLEEALRLFSCSLDGVGVSQDGPSSSPMSGDPAGTSGAERGMAPAPQRCQHPSPATRTSRGRSDVPPSPCADPHNQALGEPVGELAASEKVPLQEALVLFGCSPDGVGVSQHAPSRSSMPGDAGGTGAATPHRDFSSLSLPEEMLTPDYCIPELSDAMLSLEIFNIIGMEPQELWEDAGMDLPPSPPATAAPQPGSNAANGTFENQTHNLLQLTLLAQLRWAG